MDAMSVFRTVKLLFGGPDATLETLQSEYRRFEAEGDSEGERLFRLFSTRRGWQDLPEALLRELSERLNTVENIADFVHLSERHRLETVEYQTVVENSIKSVLEDASGAMRNIAAILTRHYPELGTRRQQGDVETVRRLAVVIAPEISLANPE